jgi:hypothetical protein
MPWAAVPGAAMRERKLLAQRLKVVAKVWLPV